MAGCPGIQVPDYWDFPARLGIRSLEDRNKRGIPRRLSSLRDRDNRDIPSNLGIRAVRIPDIRKQDTDRRDIHSLGTRMPGSRNRCPVAVEV